LSFTEDESGNKLKRIFKDGIKFTCIGIISIGTYFLSFKEKTIPPPGDVDLSDSVVVQNNASESIIFSLIAIIIGLIILYVFEKKKKRGWNYCRFNAASICDQGTTDV